MKSTAFINNNLFKVRQACNVEIKLISDHDLRTGDLIEFQFPHSWMTIDGQSFTRQLQTSAPRKEYFINVYSDNAQFELSISPNNLFLQDGPTRHGRLIRAKLREGRVKAGEQIILTYANTMAPYIAETEYIMIRVKGKTINPPVKLIVEPDEAVYTRIIVPSGVEPGKPFEILVVSLDKFDNCSASTFENMTLKMDNGEIAAENLSFQGSVRIPFSIAREGVYRFSLGGIVSNAIRVQKDHQGPYWGDIHIHTKLSTDGQGSTPYEYACDVSGLDFASVVDHSEGLGKLGYAQVSKWASESYKPGRFVSIYADERNPVRATGHHNMYFRTLEAFNRFQTTFDDPENADRHEEFLDEISVKDVMLIPHHTGVAWLRIPDEGIGAAVDFDALGDCAYRPVMEIYSAPWTE